MNKALLILCYTADTPHRTGSQETVRWLGSELVGDTSRTGSKETVRWLGSGFTYYEKRIDYVRAEQPKKA